jgi:hypothetical protein
VGRVVHQLLSEVPRVAGVLGDDGDDLCVSEWSTWGADVVVTAIVVVVDAVMVVDSVVVVAGLMVVGAQVVEMLHGVVVLSETVLVEDGTVTVEMTSGSAAEPQLPANRAMTRRSTRSFKPPMPVLLISPRSHLGCSDPAFDAVVGLCALRERGQRAGSSR